MTLQRVTSSRTFCLPILTVGPRIEFNFLWVQSTLWLPPLASNTFHVHSIVEQENFLKIAWLRSFRIIGWRTLRRLTFFWDENVLEQFIQRDYKWAVRNCSTAHTTDACATLWRPFDWRFARRFLPGQATVKVRIRQQNKTLNRWTVCEFSLIEQADLIFRDHLWS